MRCFSVDPVVKKNKTHPSGAYINSRARSGGPMSGALLLGGILGTTFLLGACAVIPKPGPVGNRAVPEPEKAVDIRKYMGLWYEQFRYENAFEKHMDEVTARYVMNDNGTVRVINRGKTKQGKWKQSTGRARVTPNTEAAKLRVSFFFPFYGNYWILDHDSDYSWSIVGEPSGRYLWILTRDQHPSPDLLIRIEARVKDLGYNWSLIRPTRQAR
ncbi:lipocalin family protein [Asaia spathodeae]|uniref:lipocalin family protein n=1 Tax=Asaia spathodeae TaxID=657016 RepID=UPI002FC333A9